MFHEEVSIISINRIFQLIEEFFRRQNLTRLLKYKNHELLDDAVRKDVVNCIMDFMVEACGNGDPRKIGKNHKQMTAQATIGLFVGLRSKETGNELVKFYIEILLELSFIRQLYFSG